MKRNRGSQGRQRVEAGLNERRRGPGRDSTATIIVDRRAACLLFIDEGLQV